VTLPLAFGLVRFRDRAAYAAGVSTFCRRPSHFSFAGPRTRRSACERRSRPEGRRAGCPESKKSNPEKMAFRAPVAPCGIQALKASVFGTGRSIRHAVRLHRNAPSRRGALHGVEYKRWRFGSPDCDRRNAYTQRLHRNAPSPRGLKANPAKFGTTRQRVHACRTTARRDVQLRCTTRRLGALAFDLRAPSRTGRLHRPAPSGGAFSFGIATISVVTFLWASKEK